MRLTHVTAVACRFQTLSRRRLIGRQMCSNSEVSSSSSGKGGEKRIAELNSERMRKFLEKYGFQRDSMLAPDALRAESPKSGAPLKKQIPVVTGEVPDIKTIGQLLEDSHGAFDVDILDVRDKAQFADWLVICSGRTERHVRVIADGIKDDMRRCAILVDGDVVGIVGSESTDWKAVDVGNIVVHVMTEDARSLYDLEGLWKPDKFDENSPQDEVRLE